MALNVGIQQGLDRYFSTLTRCRMLPDCSCVAQTTPLILTKSQANNLSGGLDCVPIETLRRGGGFFSWLPVNQ